MARRLCRCSIRSTNPVRIKSFNTSIVDEMREEFVQSRPFVETIGCSIAVWCCPFASKTVTCRFGNLFLVSRAAFSAASYVPYPDFSCRSTATKYCSVRGTLARIGAGSVCLFYEAGLAPFPRFLNFRRLGAAITANPPPPHALPLAHSD